MGIFKRLKLNLESKNVISAWNYLITGDEGEDAADDGKSAASEEVQPVPPIPVVTYKRDPDIPIPNEITASALRPEGGDHAAEPWGDVKTRILTNIHRCIRSREKGIEIPFDLLVFIKAQAMWYYSEVGVDFERKAKTLKFVGFDQSLNQTVRSRRRASRRPLLDHNEAPMQLQGLDQRRQRVWREEISAAKRASSWVPQTSPTPQQQADGESHISSKKPFIQWGSINPPPRAHQGRRCSG
ncbi:hypothetical protein BC567DRAFT_250704 [Phyllosticta citribraziliensis]